jgi:phospholipase C
MFCHFSPPINPKQSIQMNGKDGVEYVSKEQEYMANKTLSDSEKIEGTVGLGYRVPMMIVSPWTRGGYVNSEIADHTSVLQFLEKFISKKYNKDVTVEAISDWRRSICGDLTSAFNKETTKNAKY